MDVRMGGRLVGRVDEDGVFWRRVRENQVLRRPPAIALHREVLDQLAAVECRAVAFEMPDGSLLTGPFSLFEMRGFAVNRGAGDQVAVLLADFMRMSAPSWTRQPSEVGQ